MRQFVYSDESGTHQGAKMCVVAGYRGSPGQWKAFNKDWRAVLAKYRIKDFHTNVFLNRHRITDPKRNPYLKWTDRRADAFFGELVMAIRRRKIHPVGCAVVVRDFESYSYGERSVLAGYMTEMSRRKSHENPAPYHVAFRVTLEDAVVGTDPETELHFVFADHQEYKHRALECWDAWKRLTPGSGKAKDITFESPVVRPQLQAADLLVHHWYNFLSRGQHRLNKQNFQTMNQLTDKRNDMLVCDVSGIERIFQNLGVTEAGRQKLREARPL